MARHSPTGFAFGMLLEIAAVVVIVSLLPRFDLRPKTAAGEPMPKSPVAGPGAAPFFTPAIPEKVVITQSPKSDPLLRPDDLSPPSLGQAHLASHEVEQRLDRASQGLVNTLGSAAADLADGVLHSASRPAIQPLSPTPQWAAPRITPPAPSRPLASPAAQTPLTTHRRWMNY